MRHGYAGRQFGRDTTARKALLRGLAMQLIEHGQIRTTLAKAKDLVRVVAPLITRARTDTLANRRIVSSMVTNPITLKALFEQVAPLFKDVPGGYTRVMKMGFRKGDDAPMALIEFTKKTPKIDTAKAVKAAKAEAPKAEAAAAKPKAAKAKKVKDVAAE